jgi:hypothetical protein
MSSNPRLWTLYRRHPYCWWCGVRVRKIPRRDGESQPARLATIDHLNSRSMYPDGRPQTSRRTLVTVLSCWQCNQDRSVAEQQDRDWVPPLMRKRNRTYA